MFRFFENCVNPFLSNDDQTPPANVWKFLSLYLLPLRSTIALGLVFTAIAAAIEVWLVYYAGRLVDTLSNTSRETLWVDFGGEFIWAAAILLILRPCMAFINEAFCDIAYRPNAVSLIRWGAHNYVLRQSVAWFQRGQSGQIANRVRELGNAATSVGYEIIHTLAYVIFYMIGSIWFMASIDLRLGIPLVVWLTLYLSLMALSVPKFHQQSERFQSSLSSLSGLLVDTYSNIDTIKLFANRSTEDTESRRIFEATRTTFIKVQRLEVMINAAMVFLGNVLLVGLVGYAIYLWQINAAPLGLVAAALAMSIRISSMADWMLESVAGLFNELGATEDALKSVAQPIDIVDVPNAIPLKLTGGAITINNLQHHYGLQKGGLNNVTLSIASGEKIGLVGPSGAGKSTLVKLLLRFHEAERGSIEVDGQNIRTITQDSLRQAIAMVTQEATLLHRSLRDNIAFGSNDLTDDAITEAAKKAAADEFILSLVDLDGNKGLNAHTGERGVRLSGGQRQRIALARAIIKDAPILILDEATSALDSEAEAAIQETLYGIMKDKTVIAIAHRLSTIAHMDRIIVLDNGLIAQSGTHDELLKANGLYARLWNRQSGGFIGT